jgi:hypothetical protein
MTTKADRLAAKQLQLEHFQAMGIKYRVRAKWNFILVEKYLKAAEKAAQKLLKGDTMMNTLMVEKDRYVEE